MTLFEFQFVDNSESNCVHFALDAWIYISWCVDLYLICLLTLWTRRTLIEYLKNDVMDPIVFLNGCSSINTTHLVKKEETNQCANGICTTFKYHLFSVYTIILKAFRQTKGNSENGPVGWRIWLKRTIICFSIELNVDEKCYSQNQANLIIFLYHLMLYKI